MNLRAFLLPALGIITILCLIIFIPKTKKYKDNRAMFDQAFERFLTTRVNGRVKKIEYIDHAVGLTLSDDAFYLIEPNQNSEGLLFEDATEKGDSIFKGIDDNVIQVFKTNGQILHFEFGTER